MSDPSAEPILDLIEAFRRSKTMFAAVAMGVFDRLAAGPASAVSLAEGDSGKELARLLDACVGLGLLEKTGSSYANTPLAATYLVTSSPHSLAGYARYSNRALFPMWAHLEDAVREGSNRWQQTFGFEGDLFTHFFRTREAQRDFLMGMHGIGMLSSPAVVSAFDLSGFRHLVDLGGATGHLAVAARARYPNLRATVLDLPSVVEFGRTVSPEVKFLGCDFFREPLPEADLFAMGRIVHDWGLDRLRALLAKVYTRLPAGGVVLIAEKLLDDDHTGPVSAHMQSLNMLICTEGRERSLQEYAELL